MQTLGAWLVALTLTVLVWTFVGALIWHRLGRTVRDVGPASFLASIIVALLWGLGLYYFGAPPT